MTDRSELVDAAHHVVIKIGSAVLLGEHGRVDRTTFVSIVEGINALIDNGKRVTVVSSGAVALGRRRLGYRREEGAPDLPRLQALAALGQPQLIQMYDREFAEYGRHAAQVLLGRADLDQRTSFLNARLTLDAVHRLGAVPIVNENDTVATDEIRFGDNDELAAAVCGIVQAEMLVILSDVQGVLERTETGLGPRIAAIASDDPALDRHAGPSVSGFGRGGMISKVASARSAGRFGAATVIAPGKQPGVLRALWDGADVGTLITPPSSDALQGKKVWLGAGAVSVGRLRCDAGAKAALTSRGASLLPSGIREVAGDFAEGAVVELLGPDGVTFARGMSTYSSEDTRRIMGKKSDEIAEVLGYKVLDAAVHRDNLLIL